VLSPCRPDAAARIAQGVPVFGDRPVDRRDMHIFYYHYLANKRSFHVRSQGLEISTLIEKIEK
jgi:hypothetical protein